MFFLFFLIRLAKCLLVFLHCWHFLLISYFKFHLSEAASWFDILDYFLFLVSALNAANCSLNTAFTTSHTYKNCISISLYSKYLQVFLFSLLWFIFYRETCLMPLWWGFSFCSFLKWVSRLIVLLIDFHCALRTDSAEFLVFLIVTVCSLWPGLCLVFWCCWRAQ